MRNALIVAAIAAVVSIGGIAAAQRPAPVVEVYKSPTCGCCALWVKHLEANGFRTKVTDTADMASVKTKLGVPARTQSCHTAVVDGYVLEGHVPAAQVQRLLKERPQVVGVAVPGMPIGSPGMEAGPTVQPYDVLAFDKQGQTRVFALVRKVALHYLLLYDVVDDYVERRAQFRAAHLALARAAVARGDSVLGGALANPVDGTVLLFKADSPAVAEAFAQADPDVTNGLVTRWRVREWTTVVGPLAEVKLPPTP